MEAEQAKHPGKCLYHLTKSHPTCDCYIKKECEKLVAARKPVSLSLTSGSPATSQLHNIKEAEIMDEEILEDDIADMLPDSNDINKEDLFDHVHIKNHYLQLVKVFSYYFIYKTSNKISNYCEQWGKLSYAQRT
jgi:hypothetical protein